MNLDQAKNARKEIDVALKALSAKIGIDFTIGNIRFTDVGLKTTLTGTERGAAGTSKSAPANPHLVALMKNKFLLPSTFDQSKTYKSDSLGNVKIVGYNSRARKYPFIALTAGGKRYRVTSFSARSMVERGAV